MYLCARFNDGLSLAVHASMCACHCACCAGSVAPGEIDSLWTVCKTNDEVVDHLAAFYKL